ncbi:mucin-4-like isoform X2 [Calypte anna]|uniref:mucin-4-like isoform X2 n=1 Tax=Calypte anna TaxID=9244 RepID=UPI0011C3B2E2|nr:mucin-4-like isoform X2 [Calypte anna]
MGTRGWTLSTFVGCCIWILHGLRAATAVPVTTEGPLAPGTSIPIAAETERPYTQVMGTAETNIMTADAEMVKSILTRNPEIPSFPPGDELGTLVTAASDNGSTIPTMTNVTKPLNASQDTERGSAVLTTATTAATFTAQHPAVTPDTELDIMEATTDAPLGATPLFANVEYISEAVTRGGAQDLDLDPTASAMPFLTIPSSVSASSLSSSQEGRLVSGAVGITPEPAGEIATAAEESPSASVPGDAGDAVDGASSTSDSSHPSPESVTALGRVGNPGEASFLPGQATLSLTAPLTPASSGDGVGQRAPAVSLNTPGSALLLADTEAPTVTGDMTTLLPPRVAIGVQSDTDSPAPATGEQTPPLTADLQSPMDTSSISGAAYPPLGAGTSTLPAADNGAEMPVSPGFGTAQEAPLSPSLGASQSWGTETGASQGADEPGDGLNSALGALNPTSSIPDGLSWPTAGVSAQEGEGAGDMAQAESPRDSSPSEDTHSDVDPSGFNTQKDSASTGELPSGETGEVTNAELSPLPPLGDEAGAAPALGQMSPPDSAPTGSAGLESDLLGAEGSGNLPGESPITLGAPYSPPGSAASPVSAAEPPVSPDLGAAQGAAVSPSLESSQPQGTAAGAAQGAGLPGADGPGTGLTSEWDASSSTSSGLVGPPSPALGPQLGTSLGLSREEGLGAGTTEQAPGEGGSETGFEPSLGSAAGSRMAAGMDQLSGAGSLSGPASPSDLVAEPSVSRGYEEGPMPATGPGLDSLSVSPLDSETVPVLAPAQETDSTGDAVPSENTEVETPYVETGPSGFSTQKDSANTGELPSGETGEVTNAELSPLPPLGDEAGAAPALGQISPPDSAPTGSAGLESDLLGAEGPGNLPGESLITPGAAYPPSGSAADVGAAQGAAVSPSLEGSQPQGTAAGAAQGAGLPGADGPGTGLTSEWDASSSTSSGLVGPPSPALGPQLGTSLELPAAEGYGAGTTEQAPGEGGSETGFEPSLGSAAGSGMAAGMDQLSGAGSLSGLASPSDLVAAPSVSDSASPSALGGAGSATGAPQPFLGAGLGVPPAVEKGAGEVAGNGGSLEQSQVPAGGEPLRSGAPAGAMLQSASSSTSLEGSSLLGMAGETVNGASLPGAGGTGSGLSTGLEAAGPKEFPASTSGIQSGADLGLSGAKLNQVNVVELPEGALVNGGPSPVAKLGEGTGPIVQIASGSLAPSVPSSPKGTQPLVPVAPGGSGVSSGTATSMAAPLLPPEHELSSGLAPSGDTNSTPGTQSGGRPLVPGAQGGLAGEAGVVQTWSLEDEEDSGMASTLEEASPRAPASPTAALALPSAPQRENTAEGTSAIPGLSAPLLGLPAVPLYSYGARENDQEYVERRVDFSSPLFKPETGFPFGKTLRDSLYFTDNGQIIFPSSDNNVFTYPNPPSRGFNGHEEVPMIAVFWDNADFSRGVGTTYFQEFLTLDTAKPPFVRDVEAKIRRYLRSSYSAAWTLKITWEKAPAYTARTDTRRTNTYQAVLTTDGFRSYVLMLYQEGGMGWDYTRLAATNVLIGYTSGDGSYRNDDLTRRPPAEKYRPDQFRGYNSDLRGLWIYKLESRVGVNYRMKCLAWTGQQQEPQMWSQDLPACPCSLQQGQQDPRFKSSRRGWWTARISMLHSSSPNQHGAGVRCLYDSQSQLIEGRQERYWRSSRQASPYRDQELKLYDWCCNQAGSAHLCTRYNKKRPKIGCDGYQSPSTGSSEEVDSDLEEQRDGEDE